MFLIMKLYALCDYCIGIAELEMLTFEKDDSKSIVVPDSGPLTGEFMEKCYREQCGDLSVGKFRVVRII